MEDKFLTTKMTEKILTNKKNGMGVLLGTIVLLLGGVFLCIFGAATNPLLTMVGILILCLGWIPFLGLKVLKPQEALVLTLFGKYIGTLKGDGFYAVNPFCTSVNPAAKTRLGQSGDVDGGAPASSKLQIALGTGSKDVEIVSKKISLKAMTLSNAKQKVNDVLGNPVEIGVAVIWRVTDTAKAVFNVDNTGDGRADDGSLRGSTTLVAGRIRDMIQEKVNEAGLEIIEARITYLAYAPEIAAVMLQRQQASAVIDARKMIVDGAVGMVEMALDRLKENGTVDLDEERKAAMVSNLLVVLCGNHDAQPIVNSGSLY